MLLGSGGGGVGILNQNFPYVENVSCCCFSGKQDLVTVIFLFSLCLQGGPESNLHDDISPNVQLPCFLQY